MSSLTLGSFLVMSLFSSQLLACPACYDLVQDRVNAHRDKLQQLEDLINNVGNNPDIVNDAEFEKRLAELEEDLDNTMIDAEEAAGG